MERELQIKLRLVTIRLEPLHPMKIEELNSLIRSAFADVQYPGDDNIAGCSRIGCDDCDPIAAYFKGTTWQEHNLQTLAGYADIGFFYLEALHYYLPAYMLAEIENRRLAELHFGQLEEYEDYPDPLPNLDICGQVSSNEVESIQRHREKFVALLSKQQRLAVTEYLKFMDTDEDGYAPEEWTLQDIKFLNCEE